MSTFQVTVDPDLEPIIPRYMALQHEQLALLFQAIAEGDAETARLHGHKMKGTGSSYGFFGLTEFGTAIEKAALAGDLTSAKKLAHEVGNYLDNVRIVYGKEEQP